MTDTEYKKLMQLLLNIKDELRDHRIQLREIHSMVRKIRQEQISYETLKRKEVDKNV